MSTQASALEEVRRTRERNGTPITIQILDEAGVTKDNYGNIIARPSPVTKTIKSYPIRFDPTDKQLEKAGIRTKVDVIFWLSTKRADQLSLSFKDIDTVRAVVIHPVKDGVEYRIKQKQNIGQYGDKFLYITLGCLRS